MQRLAGALLCGRHALSTGADGVLAAASSLTRARCLSLGHTVTHTITHAITHTRVWCDYSMPVPTWCSLSASLILRADIQ